MSKKSIIVHIPLALTLQGSAFGANRIHVFRIFSEYTKIMRFGVLTAVTVKSRPYHLLGCYVVQSGRSLMTLSRMYYLHLQGEKISQAKQQAKFSLPFHPEN
jgi:hypothetical protein